MQSEESAQRQRRGSRRLDLSDWLTGIAVAFPVAALVSVQAAPLHSWWWTNQNAVLGVGMLLSGLVFTIDGLLILRGSALVSETLRRAPHPKQRGVTLISLGLPYVLGVSLYSVFSSRYDPVITLIVLQLGVVLCWLIVKIAMRMRARHAPTRAQ